MATPQRLIEMDFNEAAIALAEACDKQGLAVKNLVDDFVPLLSDDGAFYAMRAGLMARAGSILHIHNNGGRVDDLNEIEGRLGSVLVDTKDASGAVEDRAEGERQCGRAASRPARASFCSPHPRDLKRWAKLNNYTFVSADGERRVTLFSGSLDDYKSAMSNAKAKRDGWGRSYDVFALGVKLMKAERVDRVADLSEDAKTQLETLAQGARGQA